MKGKVKKDTEDEKKEEAPIESSTTDSAQQVEVHPVNVETHPVEVEAAPVKLISEPQKLSAPAKQEENSI